jgi:catechol 2,3-dioxygenase-like lactoylglutathione lyase family enzyme
MYARDHFHGSQAGGTTLPNTPRESFPSLRLATICIDCANVDEMAEFYGRLLGWNVTRREANWILMRDPAGGTGLSFQAEERYRSPQWPEQARGQDKMLHLDIKVDDLTSAVAHALEAGARLAEHQPQERVRVLLDPADHPFCLFLD